MTCVVRKQIGYNYDKSYFLILNLAIQYVIIWNVILKCLASEASQKNNKIKHSLNCSCICLDMSMQVEH